MNAPAPTPTQALAVLNCGSSSIKFALFDASTVEPPRQIRISSQLGVGLTGRV